MDNNIFVSGEIYRKAFNQYLRKGTPIEVSLQELMRKEAERPTTHYIWRTRSDDKVRSSHAANNGKIFAWDNPPPTGHPGDDFGCKCVAEPYIPEVDEYLKQSVTSIVDEGLYRWRWYDFFNHFFLGNGKAIKLSNVGHLQDVIEASKEHVFKGVERQIFKDARSIVNGILNNNFKNTYRFYSVSFIHGRSTVEGVYYGHVVKIDNALYIDAEVEYNFKDVFTDPFDYREIFGNTSDPRAINPDDFIDGEFGGQFYDITGSWTTRIIAAINIDENKSGYR
jgi:hypothetical protein